MIEFCAREMPRWHPISISGYHIREAGSTAAQELAFTLADGFAYVEAAIERGLDVDDFAPRLSFFFNAHIDFFEEIAKYRAARRIWARELRERYGAQEPALVADALPHADRRRLADRAAARGEHRPHGARGARRGARRHAVAAHELVRRGARAADRGRGADRAAHAAGDRARDRRRQHDRPARRLVLRRGPDEPARGARPTTTSTGSRSSAAWSPAIKENFFQREIAEASFRYQREVEARQRVDRRRQPLRARGRAARSRSSGSTRRSSSSRSSACRRCAARRDSAAVERALARAEGRRRARGREPDAADRRRRARVRDDGRDVRRAPRGLGRLARDARSSRPSDVHAKTFELLCASTLFGPDERDPDCAIITTLQPAAADSRRRRARGRRSGARGRASPAVATRRAATRRPASRPTLPTKSVPLKNASGAERQDLRPARLAHPLDGSHVPLDGRRAEAPRPVLARGRALVQGRATRRSSG